MRSSFFAFAVSMLIGSQTVVALPAQRGGSNNIQLAQLLQGTGIQGMKTSQLNALIQNLQASGLCAGAGANAGAGAARKEAGAGAGAGAAAEAGAGAEAGAEEGAANEVELAGEFGASIALQGGDLKQDILFTKNAIGAFEFEFQGPAADEITVTENKTPAAPPAGFEAIEPSSFQVALAKSKGVGLTLSKIDYVFDAASAGLAGKDVTKAQVGKLCAETGSFVISETLGELEFEVEENEVTLNLNKNVTAEGEWGIFLPIAAAAA